MADVNDIANAISTPEEGEATIPPAEFSLSPKEEAGDTGQIMEFEHDWNSIQPTTFTERVDALDSANPAGLGQWKFMTGRHGEPVAVTEDDEGRLQYITISDEKWISLHQQQWKQNQAITDENERLEKLDKQRTELRPSFEDGLQHLTSEPFKALLKQKFEEDPQNAVEMLIKWRRLDQRDRDATDSAADRLAEQIIQQQAAMTARGKIQAKDTSIKNAEQDSLNRYNAGVNDPDIDASVVLARRNSESRKGLLEKAALNHSPAPNSSMLPPNLAKSPADFQGALKDWLPLIDNMVPHPSDDNYGMIVRDEVLPLLNEVAGSVGWLEPMDELALPQIVSAIYKHRNVHGEAIEIQTLRDENDKLRAEIEQGAKDPAVVQALERQHTARGTQITEAESMDLDKSGTVDIWERGDAPDERDVKSIEDVRTKTAEQKSREAKERGADLRTAEREDLAKRNKRKSTLRDEIRELELGDAEWDGINDLEEAKETATSDPDKAYYFNDEMQEQLDKLLEQRDELEHELKIADPPSHSDLLKHLEGTKWKGDLKTFADAVDDEDSEAVAIHTRWSNYEEPESQ
jgi:hypothetical protein